MSNSGKPPGSREVGALTRRDLMRTAGFSASGLMLLGTPALFRPSVANAAAATYSAGKVALELDGITTFLTSIEGGHAVADVVMERGPSDKSPGKQLGAVKFEEIVLQVPMSVSSSLAAWIDDFTGQGQMRKSGAIVYVDFNMIERKRLEFSNAVITEIALPTCDTGASKETATLTIRMAPEFTRWVGGSGKGVAASAAKSSVGTAAYSGNFRLNIQGLEPACQFITKVEGLSAKRAAPQLSKATMSPFDVSALKITLPEGNAGLFFNWFESFVIKGNNVDPSEERAGLLEWLNPTLTGVVASAALSNLGILRYAPAGIGAGKQAGRVQVDMYCESIGLTLPTA